jgi:hypothetical protein
MAITDFQEDNKSLLRVIDWTPDTRIDWDRQGKK